MKNMIIFVEPDKFGEVLNRLLKKGKRLKCRYKRDLKMYEIRY